MGEYYVDEKERYAGAIRWFNKAVERGKDPAAVAVARYRIGLAYYTDRTQHATRAKKFGEKVRSAQSAIEALLAMSGITEDLRLQAEDLAQHIREELAEHENFRKKE
jgi:TPR repeat protein